MGINVQNENITDATIQVHIAFEKAADRRRNYKKKPRNTANLRSREPKEISTGRNTAQHRSSTRNRKPSRPVQSIATKPPRQKLKALPAPKPKSPA